LQFAIGGELAMKAPRAKAQNPLKNLLLYEYASGTLSVLKQDTVDATAKKINARAAEIDEQISTLRRERDALMTALRVAGIRPPDAHNFLYTLEESKYRVDKPFAGMSLTDACLGVLRDFAGKEELHERWLDKNQVEYLVTRGGYEFKTEDPTNSVNVTLRRLAEEGHCEAHTGKGSRSNKYHFKKERVPDVVEDSRATKT
jgi:hypothetical protein